MPSFTFQTPLSQPAFSKPKAVRMGAARFEAESWTKVMSSVVGALVWDARYRDKALNVLEGSSWATKEKGRLRRAVETADGWWLEGNLPSGNTINHLLRLLAKCGYPTNEVVVEYEDEERAARPEPPPVEEEKIGVYARRMFAKAFEEQLIPEKDFRECFNKEGTKAVLGLVPAGYPLFSRTMMGNQRHQRSWVDAFPTGFGFPVFVNSQWIEKQRKRLQALFKQWGVLDDDGRNAPVHEQLEDKTEKSQNESGKTPGERRFQEKIGAYAQRELYAALEEGRVPNEDFKKLLTMEGTKDLLGYSMKTCPLFALQPMVRRDGRPGSYSHPARYKGRLVYVNGYWMERHRDNLQKLLARWGKVTPVISHDDVKTEGDKLASFSADIQEHWPEGFDFSEGALRLLESRCGKMSNRAKDSLKAGMFHPRGRLWFCPENVASEEARNAVVATAKRFVREWGLMAVKVLSDILDVPGTKLKDEDERDAFTAFLARQSGLSVCELEGRAYVSAAGASDEKETAEALCGLVREFIAEQGGVVQTERILEEFKNLDEQSLSDLMARWEPDAIPERDENGFLSFKLLSEYYLPEDFGAALKEGLARAEEEGTPPTAAWLTTFLSERYGCDFAVDYALDPAGALKWVISAVWRKDEANDLRRWNGEGARARFVPMDEHEGATSPPRDLPTQVEMAFPGVFTNEDFWQYSVGHYGLSDTRAAKVAQLGYIAPCFVRLDRDHWMSVAAFRRATGWNDTISEAVAEVLREALGSSPMLPVASLGASVTDALPEVVLQGDDEPRVLRWTPELVASVAALLCPGLHVANHGVAPLAVTALLVPKPVATKDVFTYAMGLYCVRNPHGRSVEGAFAFLKANSIAFRLTARARAEIEDYLVKEGG